MGRERAVVREILHPGDAQESPTSSALPIVCSRHFRFSAFYVNKKSKIKTARDLKGKKVGSPEWAHTAAVYMRGWLGDEHGVKLTDVDWYQAGTNEPGRTEKVELNLPKGVKLTRVDDKSLSDMLAAGEIDCALVARPPDCFVKGHPDVARLFPNYLEMEEQYYARTKVWPIMHVIAVKKQILDQYPWVAGSLYNAFLESKNRSLERFFEQSVSRYPIPWVTTYARRMRDMFDGDPFPFGIEAEPPDLGAVPALRARAGHRPPPRQGGGHFPARHDGRRAYVTRPCPAAARRFAHPRARQCHRQRHRDREQNSVR